MCVAASRGGAARGARVPHGGARGLPGRLVRGDARGVARGPGAAAHLRRHAPAPRRHARPGARAAAAAAAAHPPGMHSTAHCCQIIFALRLYCKYSQQHNYVADQFRICKSSEL